MSQPGQEVFSTMYVELDCMLDTRFAVLFKMDPENVRKAYDSNYHERLTDLIPGVDREEFLKAYAARDKSILQNAMITPIGQMAKEFAQRTTENTLNSPYHFRPKIMLNVYPYELDEDEKEVLRNTLIRIVSDLAVVQVVSIPPEKVTPLFAKANLSLMVMYRYDEWLELHCANKNFEKHTIPDISLIGPRVYFKKPEFLPKEGEDPFQDMEKMASPLVKLNLLPPTLFSLVLKVQKKTA